MAFSGPLALWNIWDGIESYTVIEVLHISAPTDDTFEFSNKFHAPALRTGVGVMPVR